MRLIDSGFMHPDDAIAMDSASFELAEQGESTESLRFWESRRTAVIVGSSADIGREVHETVCGTDKVAILRRQSGGGAVVVAPGCLNYSLVLSLDARPDMRQVRHSYDVILGRIVEAVGLSGLAVDGVSDLVINGCKVSGSAQRRGRRTLLHHGTFLYAFDIPQIERYLKQPERQPAYRAGRPHADFVVNLPLGPDRIKAALARACGQVRPEPMAAGFRRP